MPKPVRMLPMVLTRSDLANVVTKAPMPARPEKMTVVERESPPDMPHATIWPVTVVPMLAPKMTVAACVSDMMPALRNPMAMTVVAPELWMATAHKVPMPTPSSLLFEADENRSRSLPEPSVSRFLLIMEQATRKTPTPATRVRMAVAIWMFVMFVPSGEKTAR